MDDARLQDRYAGCVVGQRLGDALGFVVEGYPPRICRQYVEDYLRAGRTGEIGGGPFPFGQYTDDSQLARELLQSYVKMGRFDPVHYARAIAAIFAEGRIVGRGRATEQAAHRLLQGVPWDEAGTPPPSAGNGSAMRAGPVGLMEPEDRDRLLSIAHDQGRITHSDPRCSAGAAAIARAVALALRDEQLDVSAFLEDLAELAGRVDASVAAAVRELEAWLSLEPEEAAGHISRAGLEPGYRDGWEGISPFVISSVCWALYSFLRSPEDYWETICTAIAVGGDVDTTAAMAEAISGAHMGLQGFLNTSHDGSTTRAPGGTRSWWC